MRKYLKPALGIIAFVIGGIVAREQAFGAVDTIDDMVHRKKNEAKQKAGEQIAELQAEARN